MDVEMLVINKIIVVYLVAINVVTFVVYGIDKRKAVHSKWRIPEATLLLLAALGGSIGAWLGMRVWHHKTLHKKFRYGVPLIIVLQLVIVLLLTSCSSNAAKAEVTAEMAYQGVDNYCHSVYDWSVAEDSPELMYVKMGEENDTAYQVLFRSYTGALVLFYVDKTSGATKIVERVPVLNVEEEAGTMNIYDYLK